ncbi:MAG: diphosphate--fructose-6-phosphate 1-phosphotransferase [Treponema sp.]|nr:diphosphate--fructose-6-phosphate 1-phosphotransferase [Treponema sp.]
MEISELQKARYEYKPKLPASLSLALDEIAVKEGGPTEALSDREEFKKIFARTYGKPVVAFSKGGEGRKLSRRALRVGAILSGGQAPGGHNVIAGLYDGLKAGNPDSALFGFLDGPGGLVDGKHVELSAQAIDAHRNTGGFDIIGSGRTKIETPEQFAASLETAKKLALDAIVVIGGDDSNTNAALLAEYFLEKGSDVKVIGCPKTIDGDLKNDFIETSFGFDTACKTYGELIGNLARDAGSAKKHWHFVRLMGRAASHIALECALRTKPNVCLISEEIEAKALSLESVAGSIVDSIVKRAVKGDDFGVVLIPEGLVEFVPEIKRLIAELNDAVSGDAADEGLSLEARLEGLSSRVSAESMRALRAMPADIAGEFLADRDPHGNVQVSKIQTEKLLVGMVEARLRELKKQGAYKGKFTPQTHFFGYEGRCAFPSNFDADYCYALGFGAFALVAAGLTGYISCARNLTAPAAEWEAGGAPLTMMMNIERRHGAQKPVIKKALVDLDGRPFRAFAALRDDLAVHSRYVFPGAIQYWGPPEVSDDVTATLRLERGGE